MKRSSLRTLIIGGSALALVTSISPIAFADTTVPNPTSSVGAQADPPIGTYPPDNPIFMSRIQSIESLGDALVNQAQDLAKRLGKNGANNPTLVAAITAYQTARTNAITWFNATTANAKGNYSSSIAPALTALQAAQDNSKGDKTALKAAKEAFRTSTKGAVAAYRAAIQPAQRNFRTLLMNANASLSNTMRSARGLAPKPTSTPTSTPSPTKFN
jgi:hypothetical protein